MFLNIIFAVLALVNPIFGQNTTIRLTLKADSVQKINPRLAARYYFLAFSQNHSDYLAVEAVCNYLRANQIDSALSIAQKISSPQKYLCLAKVYAAANIPQKSVDNLKAFLQSVPDFSPYKLQSDTILSKISSSEQWRNFWQKYNNVFAQQLDRLELNVEYGKNLDAIEQINNLEKQNNSPRLHRIAGDNFFKLKDYKNAISEYKLALNKAYDKFSILLKLAKAYEMSNDYGRAYNFYAQAYKMRPFQLDLLIKMANCKERTGDFATARQLLKKYEKYKPSENIRYKIAESYYFEKDYLSAISMLNKLLQKDQAKYEFFTLRGKSFFKVGDYQHAYKDLSMSLDLNPNQPELYYILGESAYFIGHRQEGCLYWQQSKNTFHDPLAEKKLQTFCKNK